MIAIENKKVKLDELEKGPIISFSNNDNPKGFDQYHDDLMVITTAIHNYVVERILMD